MSRRLKRPVLLAGLALALTAPSADAFCGFYVGGAGAKMFNEATVVVLMRDGTKTVLSMQNAYKGPPEKFAMVVPVPVVLHEENVKTLSSELFEHIDQLASPRLVEYWEQDPCAEDAFQAPGGLRKLSPPMAVAESAADTRADLGVKVEAQFVVGEYQIVILSAEDSGGLDTWLHREGYAIPEGGEPYFRPYVASGSKFFVAKVDPSKVKFESGLAVLSPLRFHYDSDAFRLPVRLGLINSSGTQDLIVHILGVRTRYEVANYPNVTIPTNLDVSEAAQSSFGTFYTTLFDRTVMKNPKAVVTEYAWQPMSCDPCPGPAMNYQELETFGMDVIAPPIKATDIQGTPSPSTVRRSMSDLVLTRLHVRYTKDSLGEDLVFREAKPIQGGREVMGADGKLEHGATPTSFNNFQARYAVRHPWTGPIACKEPHRGRWGGPPGHGVGMAMPKAAAKLGLTPRSASADLSAFVKDDIPELDVKAAKKKGGCLGCAVTTTEEPSIAGLGLGALGLVISALRRRARNRSIVRA